MSRCCYLHPQTGNHAEGCRHFRYGEETPSAGEKRRREKFNREKQRGQLDLADESHKQRELFEKARNIKG